MVSAYAGNAGFGLTDALGSNAYFLNPNGLAVNSSAVGDALYVVDTGNQRVRFVSTSQVVSTIAGSGAASYADGRGTTASFSSPQDVAVFGSVVIVTDSLNHVLRVISLNGTVTTLTGTPGVPGWADGASPLFNQPYGIVANATSGVIWITDRINSLVRMLVRSPAGALITTTLAGSGSPSFADGAGTAASFFFPQGLALAADGMIFVAGA